MEITYGIFIGLFPWIQREITIYAKVGGNQGINNIKKHGLALSKFVFGGFIFQSTGSKARLPGFKS